MCDVYGVIKGIVSGNEVQLARAGVLWCKFKFLSCFAVEILLESWVLKSLV